MSIVAINQQNYENEVLQADKPVLLDFYADWCGSCRAIGPILEEVAAERPDIKVGKVNVDQESDLAGKFGIMSIPTLVLLREGKSVQQVVGVRPKDQILALL